MKTSHRSSTSNASFIVFNVTCVMQVMWAIGCVRYNEDFVISRLIISRFCSIHVTVILVGLKKIVRYTEDFVI